MQSRRWLCMRRVAFFLFCEPCVLTYVVCWSMRRRQKMLSSFSRLTFYGFSSSICLEDTWKKRRKKGCQNFFRLFKIQLIIFVPKQTFSLFDAHRSTEWENGICCFTNCLYKVVIRNYHYHINDLQVLPL